MITPTLPVMKLRVARWWDTPNVTQVRGRAEIQTQVSSEPMFYICTPCCLIPDEKKQSFTPNPPAPNNQNLNAVVFGRLLRGQQNSWGKQHIRGQTYIPPLL